MKILVLAPETPVPPTSGSRQRTFHLARELAAAADVDVVALGRVPEDAREPFSLRAVEHRTTRFGALARSLRQPYLAAKVASPAAARLASAARWDTVQAELPFMVAAATHARAPIVLDTQNVETDVVATMAELEPRFLHRARWRWETRKTARFERRVVGIVDAVCAVSDADAATFERWGAQNVVVVPNGVDTATTAYQPPGEGPALAYVGHFGYRPNALAALELVDDVLPAVRAQGVEASALVVGRDPTPELVTRAGPAVEVTGEVPDVLVHLRRAAALVLPIRAGGGSRLKILEAMAAGVPVVSTKLGILGLDARDGEHFLLGETRGELAAQAVRVVRDRPLALALSRSARALVERRYDWSIVARPLIELHASLAERR
jgi:glycosyltransferase involved in cell wall biosynthesis